MKQTQKLKVDIWSDVMCPFCYIGKRHFERALEHFPHKDEIEVTWHAFQLDPTLKAGESLTTQSYLSSRKGIPAAHVAQMEANVTQMAAQSGLEYHLDKAVVTNTFNAHRLAALARERGFGDAMEERLFAAHLTESLDIADASVLARLGEEVGILAEDVKAMLTSDDFTQDVKKDLATARQIGVTGVPFFVLDSKYAVSGAQAPETFLSALTQTWKERNPQPLVTVADGNACSDEGCDW